MESNRLPKRHKNLNPISAQVTIIIALIVILVLYTFLMLKNSVPGVGWAPLLILFFLYWRFGGKINLPTPIDFPVLMLLMLAGFSLTFSLDKELALPKFYGLLLGVITFYFIVTYISHKRDLKLPIIALVVMPITLAITGLVTLPRILSMGFISSFLSISPQLSALASSATFREIINPNTLAGALSFFIPILVSLIWDNKAYHNAFPTKKIGSQTSVTLKFFVWIALIFSVITLVVSSSRGAIIGSALGIFIVAVIRDRRFLWVLPVLVLAGLLIVYVGLHSSLSELIIQSDINADLPTFQYRHDIWNYSLNIIKDFPLTGIGLDQFDQVLRSYYFYSSDIFSNRYIAHSHNNFFAVAVELGLPGLVLYSSLIGAFFTMAWRSWQSSGSLRRVLIIGLACGMLAHLVFGVMDAFTLGKKLGVFLWIFLALMTTIYRLSLSEQENAPLVQFSCKQGIQQSVLWSVFGIVTLLMALSFVNVNPLFAFITALLGGVIIGIIMINHWNSLRKMTVPILTIRNLDRQ